MVDIKAFAATTYNLEKTNQPNKAICPPYDIITPNQAQIYRRRYSHNMIYLTLPESGHGKNRYKLASDRFRNWLNKKILVSDHKEALYFYQQEYVVKSKKIKRFHKAQIQYKFRLKLQLLF